MIASWLQLLEQNIIEASITWKNPDLTWNQDNVICPFGFFKTKDWEISLAIWNDQLWETFTKNLIYWFKWKFMNNIDRLANKKLIIEWIEDIFMNFNSADLNKKLDLLQIPNGIIHKMTDIIDNQEYINSNYIKKVDHPKLGKITVPFEFIKYDQFPLENYIISPEKNNY